MRITHVRTHVLEAKLSQPFAYSRAWYATRMAMIVEIETDDGVVGWGECYGPAWMTAAVVKSVSPLLVRHRPSADPPWMKLARRQCRRYCL
jgi:D-galactarolactone cycloisomerase